MANPSSPSCVPTRTEGGPTDAPDRRLRPRLPRTLRVRSACRVRLYLLDEAKPSEALGDAPLVIISELADNPGTSVTNAIEQIAAEVIDALALTRVPVFVEHYPPESTGGCEETFDLVVFAHHEVGEVMRGGLWRREVGPPTWKPLGRRAVEVLVGFSV